MQRHHLQQHSRIYPVLSLSMKVFSNMKRSTKGFSGQEGSLKLNELTNLVTKLSDRIGVLEDDLKKTKLTYSSTFTKLILKVKKLEYQVKTEKARKRARVVLSEDDEVIEDDSSKQGRKLSDAEVQENAEVQEKASTETEPI
ncbi:hypothetical protein Tco_0187086, partial [Tanacetum coccineum]